MKTFYVMWIVMGLQADVETGLTEFRFESREACEAHAVRLRDGIRSHFKSLRRMFVDVNTGCIMVEGPLASDG